MDPDPGGPKTCGSGGSGSGSATLVYAMKNRFEAFVAAGGGPPDSFSINRKKCKRRSDCKAEAIAEDVQSVYAQSFFWHRNPTKTLGFLLP
jgi:hypothetical protein